MISKFETEKRNENLTQEDIDKIFEEYKQQRIKAIEEQYTKKYIDDKDRWEMQVIEKLVKMGNVNPVFMEELEKGMEKAESSE